MNKTEKLSETYCPDCREGVMTIIGNPAGAPHIHCACSKCGYSRAYNVMQEIKDKSGKPVDYLINTDPVENPALAGMNPTRSGKPAEKGNDTMPSSKKKTRTFYHDSTPKDVPGAPMENSPIASDDNYLDVLAYKLNSEGFPESDDPANRRFPESDEDAAPQNKSIMPRKKRLEYRNESKPFQAVAHEGLSDNLQQKTMEEFGSDAKHLFSERKKEQDEFFDKYKKRPPDYVEIGVFSSPHPTNISGNAKKSLLKESLDNDSQIVKESGLADASFIEPSGDGGQWCPKVRHAVPYYVCSHYCIDGRRIPKSTAEFETYKDYLLTGGDEQGKVFCGYKDWIKREVTGTYPGWVEDYIEQQGGEVSKSIKPFQHKDNLDHDQRRQMPQYPDMKLIEKRLDIEKQHVYDSNKLTFATDKAKEKLQKKSESKKKKLE